MLTVLGGLAEFELELIRARTGEGRSRAKARGVRLGRSRVPMLSIRRNRAHVGGPLAALSTAQASESHKTPLAGERLGSIAPLRQCGHSTITGRKRLLPRERA